MAKNAIQKHRERMGFSREQLVTMTGKAFSSIVAYENGTRDPGTVTWKKLAEIFDATVDELMGVEKKHSSNPDELEEKWPDVVQVLRSNGKLATPAERRRIARIIRTYLEEDVDK